MTRDKRFDQSVSKWLEETAPAQLPERVLDATFERTRASRQHVGWRAFLKRLHITQFVPALGGAAVMLVAAGLALSLYANRPGVGGPASLASMPPTPAATVESTPSPAPTDEPTPTPAQTEEPTPTPPSGGPPDPFVGNWQATDPPIDSSNLTMAVIALPNGTYDVTIRDDLASVCDGASSTMTGVAEATEPGTFVIAQPEYTCDDGSEAQAISGPVPLEELLRNYTFVYDASRDVLVEGVVWSRVSATPTPTLDLPDPFVGNWQATDPPVDSSNLTMEIIALSNGTYDVTIRDDFASVCDGASSTMTGVAEATEPGTIVIEQPEYLCDDGSEAHAISGPVPLDELLRNYTFVYDAGRDALVEGVVWSRVAVSP